MSFIFNLKCCEHKQGPPGPQLGPLAFSRLCTPFYITTLNPPTTHNLYYCHVQYHYPHEKAAKTAWILGI